MADDGKFKKTQDTFQEPQEVPAEHRFPLQSGIVEIPRGSRGPRSLYIPRKDDSFGFKLRHLIVYPPDEDSHVRPSGERLQHMETIFVRSIVEGGPAEIAGLRVGDRLVAVNGKPVTDKPYGEVVNYIQQSPGYLHLLVISKEEDIIQKYYKEFAYNPVTNQQEYQPRSQEYQSRSSIHHQYHPQHLATYPRRVQDLQPDAISWRSLQNTNYNSLEQARLNPRQPKQQRSADNILNPTSQRSTQRHVINDAVYLRPRAQPQVPAAQRKMGRRASEGSSYAEREIYEQIVNNCVSNSVSNPLSNPVSNSVSNSVNNSGDMVVGDSNGAKMKTATKGGFEATHHPSLEMSYSQVPGCRLSLDGERRDSNSSLTSSLADGSKDSLNSYDSSSTITGGYPDIDMDKTMMSRIIRSLQKKEEFLRADNAHGPKEFYGRPQRFEKPIWPPQEPRNESPSRSLKPTHQNFQRVKNDIDSERDYTPPQQRASSMPKDMPYGAQEASVAPSIGMEGHINGANENLDLDDKRSPLQIVQTRAKQFESGRTLPEDDPLNDRTSFYRSELARVSEKRVVPSVTVRAREFETRGGGQEPKKDFSATVLRKNHRDSRSLDSSGSNCSLNSLSESVFAKLSGNMTIPVGSKYIHVPPPKGYKEISDTSTLENSPNRMRNRSNSADSWVFPSEGGVHIDGGRLGNGLDVTTKRDRTIEEAMDVSPPAIQKQGNLSPLIPEPVVQMALARAAAAPTLSVTPATPQPLPGAPKTPVRPTQLDLANPPKRPSRHLRPILDLSPASALEDRPLVVRRTKNTNLAEEERAMRRESYLKATEGGRMPFDSDFSDGDLSPHALRSGSVSGGSSNSSVSLDREKRASSPTEKQNVIREGSLHCKITELDGKRSADRSWKQLWVVLKGPKLYLYKDKHHLSPVGTSDVAEQSLASGIDMRASCVGIPENYTKRKHVLRVSSVVPCRSEILLQADNPVELAEWVKCLQDQVAANDEEYKTEQYGPPKQQAVPQTIPASTSIQVQGSSRLSPQSSNKSKLSNLRNRSPTGHSPVSKNRKPVQLNEAATSPKSKTWRGRVAKQFRKIQGASSPTSPTAPEAATFGVPLDHCQPSNYNQYVPRLVEACTEIIEGKGLETIGIYRVPGNNAAVSALTEEANKCYDELTQIDPRWNDVHVVSSLLKSFFRRMPDSLLTATLYPKFIEADKIENTIRRLEQIKKLIKLLPPHHYHTLKHIIFHLKRVVDNCNMNKMEAKNLAIVFGPTIVRAGEESMELMVNNMTHQCKIVESLLVYADWFFNDSSVEQLNICAPMATSEVPENEQINTNLLLDNISKVEGLKEQKDKKEFIHSLISAAQRKVGGKRKPTKSQSCSNDSKDEPSTPNGVKEFTSRSFDVTDFKESAMDDQKSYVPTTVTELEQSARPYFNYKMDRDTVQQRIKNFIQETEANLSARKSPTFSFERRGAGPISSSASNVSQTPALSLATNPQDRTITKTHSASNVYSRTTNGDNVRNSLSSTDSYKVHGGSSAVGGGNNNQHFGTYNRNSDQIYDKRRQPPSDNQSSFNDLSAVRIYNTSPTGYGMRKGNSVENLNSLDVSNGLLKKVKYENECGDVGQRTSSLDSLNKIEEDGDLVKTMTKLFDEKKKELTPTPLLNDIDLPYVDDSPEKIKSERLPKKLSVPGSPKLYRDPSLHKSQYSSKFNKEDKENVDKEKDEDSTMVQDENIPDNERNITKKINIKLKRSESLNKPERTSPLTIKLKRSESLNKSSDRLKRSDSLTKTEKTESNLNKRMATSSRRGKEFTKLKRKNGMPERSIKRRHTVGGTKDPDKVTWLDKANTKETNERNLRTSSPDLSTSRKDRLLLQFNFEIAPEEMVATFKKHFIGARPQSFPESSVYNIPLESHV